MASSPNFLDSYLEFTEKIVPIPPLYHKWAAMMAVSSMLGKRLYIPRGHLKVFPNLYVMLMGEPGTGKGVASDLLQSVLRDAGYEYFAADRSSKEKFLQDLADGISFNKTSVDDLLESVTFGEKDSLLPTESRECLILAEEFSDFLGQNNSDFVAFLTKVWSFSGTYRYRLKTGRSVGITEPFINILGGSSSAAFALTFPPEIIAQGFLARLVLVNGEATGKRVSFPKQVDFSLMQELSQSLARIKANVSGAIHLTEKAEADLDLLNQSFGGVDDPRFRDYNVRRFTQLLKLCTICCAARGDNSLRIEDVERAHDLLCETEHQMPRALGAFGKSKNADVSNKILQILYTADRPIPTMVLWRIVCDDLDKLSDLSDILHKLSSAGRIQSLGATGWLPKVSPAAKELLKIVDPTKPGEKK